MANHYMGEIGGKSLESLRGTPPSHWFRYVDDAWVKIITHGVERFTVHINFVDQQIEFT